MTILIVWRGGGGGGGGMGMFTRCEMNDDRIDNTQTIIQYI